MTNKTKTDGQCAGDALHVFFKTKTGQRAFGILATCMFVLGYMGFIPKEDGIAFQRADQAYYAELQRDTKQALGLIQGIASAENIPERLQWDLVRLEGIALSNQVYGLAFMEVAAELLPENDCEAIHSLARERVEEMRRELREAATPIIPPTLQEKLKQFEEESHAD